MVVAISSPAEENHSQSFGWDFFLYRAFSCGSRNKKQGRKGKKEKRCGKDGTEKKDGTETDFERAAGACLSVPSVLRLRHGGRVTWCTWTL